MKKPIEPNCKINQTKRSLRECNRKLRLGTTDDINIFVPITRAEAMSLRETRAMCRENLAEQLGCDVHVLDQVCGDLGEAV
jgi:hypothetical protein